MQSLAGRCCWVGVSRHGLAAMIPYLREVPFTVQRVTAAIGA